MITYLNDNTQAYYCGLSSDIKPLEVMNGALYREIDTSKEYRYDSETKEWKEQKSNRGWSEW